MSAVSEIARPVSFDAIASIPLSLTLPIPNCFTHDFGELPLKGFPGVRSGAFGEQVLIPALALEEISAALAPVDFVGTGSVLGGVPAGSDLPLNVQRDFSQVGGFYERLDEAEERESVSLPHIDQANIVIFPSASPNVPSSEPLALTGDQ